MKKLQRISSTIKAAISFLLRKRSAQSPQPYRFPELFAERIRHDLLVINSRNARISGSLSEYRKYKDSIAALLEYQLASCFMGPTMCELGLCSEQDAKNGLADIINDDRTYLTN